jgi:hypothetical protein
LLINNTDAIRSGKMFMARAQIHRARILNRYNFITKTAIAMWKKATDVLTTIFKLGRI